MALADPIFATVYLCLLAPEHEVHRARAESVMKQIRRVVFFIKSNIIMILLQNNSGNRAALISALLNNFYTIERLVYST